MTINTTQSASADTEVHTLGNAALLGQLSEAVYLTGSRISTAYGEHVAVDLADEIRDVGRPLLTGVAPGIEAAALRTALTAAQSPVIVMLRCGVDKTWPRFSADLIGQVRDGGGLLVSILPNGATPSRAGFIASSRWAAAHTARTIVVEATIRSGVHHAVEAAREAGRPVGAVPGPVTSSLSIGTNRLIANGATSLYDTQALHDFLA